MNTASMSPVPMPTRASRACSSRSEKPQSTSTRVVVMPPLASIRVALPVLPLPRLQKRIVPKRSLQVVDQQLDDALAVVAVLGVAFGTQHRHQGRFALGFHVDAVSNRAGELVAIEQLAEKAGFF